MVNFAIIAEGVTDQYVIEAVVRGWLGEDEVGFSEVQPPAWTRTGRSGEQPPPGGWTLVFRSLELGKHRDALQFNHYLILHIDTDVCEERGFDVSRQADGQGLSADTLWDRVRERLEVALGTEFVAEHGHRVIFAIAVDSVECWFMPLLSPDQKAHRARTVGCLRAANDELRARDEELLLKGDEKQPRTYMKLSRSFEKRKTLLTIRDYNPSLKRLIDQLDTVAPQP